MLIRKYYYIISNGHDVLYLYIVVYHVHITNITHVIINIIFIQYHNTINFRNQLAILII